MRAAVNTKILSMGGWTQEAGTSGHELHFSIDAPTSAPKDRAYLRIAIENTTATNIKIQAWGADGYSANAVQNQWPIFADVIGNSVNFGYSSNENFPIKICTFKSSEIALISGMRADNNSNIFSMGYFFPSAKADWWDNNSLFAFTPSDGACSRLRTPTITPYYTNYSDVFIGSDYGPVNINTGGGRDLHKRLILNQSVGNRNTIGQTSADFGILGAGGLAPLSQTQIDGEVWVNLNSSCSISIRIL